MENERRIQNASQGRVNSFTAQDIDNLVWPAIDYDEPEPGSP